MPPIVQYLIYLLVAAAVVVLVRSVQASVRDKDGPAVPTSPEPPRPLQSRFLDGRNLSAETVLRHEPKVPVRHAESEMGREHAYPPRPAHGSGSATISPLRQEQSRHAAPSSHSSSRTLPHIGAGASVESSDNLWDLVVFLRDQVEQLRSQRDEQVKEIEQLRAALAEFRREEQLLRARRARTRQGSAPDAMDGPDSLH